MDYSQHFSTLKTPQSEQASPKQQKNNAGGYTFVLDDWGRLDRFLLLGADGGTYYVKEKKLTVDNARCVQRCLDADGARTVERIASVSEAGRAPKNDAAIFALAIAAGHPNTDTRHAALAALPRVCRIGTHLFHFVRDVEGFRRWGSSLRRAVSNWYLDKPADRLAYDAVKYQQRDGWAHRDVVRLAHPKATTAEHQAVLRYIVAGSEGLAARDVKRRKRDKSERVASYGAVGGLPRIIEGFERAKGETDARNVAALIREYGLTHEMIPSESKNSVDVWDALAEHMPMTALVRNLAKMTAVGLFKPMGAATKRAAVQLADADAIRKARLHPMTALVALKTYEQGHGDKGSLTWTPVREIVDALNDAFYLAFDAVEPTGKNHLLALDVSGSMSSPISGMPISCRDATAVLAMVTARVEKNWHVVGFTGNSGFTRSNTALTPLAISPKQRLDDVIRTISGLSFGGTDCALPMLYAAGENLDVDVFHIYTDNETWAGNVHPHQALQTYRNKSGRAAKLCVVGMTATESTIGDPNDPGTFNVVGLDTATPALLADFAR